ncbi:hypothetical protein [Roseivirga seohaensis]|uniref:hypothetical protein n=1 Tax=Roseivirga seohaensis TaxID=1914963 RepID=UPI003BAD4CC1
MNLQIPILLRTFEVQNHTNGATRSSNPCSGFLLDYSKGTPFALWLYCNGIANLPTRSCDFAAGSEGAFLFKKMQNHTKKGLLDQIEALQSENRSLKTKVGQLQEIVAIKTKLNEVNNDALTLHRNHISSQSAVIEHYKNAFSITPHQAKSLKEATAILQKLSALPIVKPQNS